MVEWARLESGCAGNGTVGSNPTLSAINQKPRSNAGLLVYVGPGLVNGAKIDDKAPAGAAGAAEQSDANPTEDGKAVWFQWQRQISKIAGY